MAFALSSYWFDSIYFMLFFTLIMSFFYLLGNDIDSVFLDNSSLKYLAMRDDYVDLPERSNPSKTIKRPLWLFDEDEEENDERAP